MGKPKIALYWCSSCGGCEESVIDIAEDILTVASLADIVFWPVAIDTKYDDLKNMKDKSITATLINGSVRMSEQEHMAKLLRKKSRFIIAQGSCAHIGGVYGLGNFFSKAEILDQAYKEVPSVKNASGVIPGINLKNKKLNLSEFNENVKPLNQVIDVDYYIPGCPSNPKLIVKIIIALLKKKPPPKGSVIAEEKALCESCSRRDSKPDKIKLKKFQRLYDTEWDPEKCFLDQGIICLGPVTRGGCEERCIKGNFPCRGCFGPVDNVKDQGLKAVSMLASILGANDEKELEKIIGSIPDAAGLFYRYSLPSSILEVNKNRKIRKFRKKNSNL